MRLLAVTLLLLVSNYSYSQWQQTEGPKTTVSISDILSADSVLLASAPCGTFLSDHEGSFWLPVNYETFNTSTFFKDTLYLGGESVRKVLHVRNKWIERYSIYKKGKVFDLYADAQRIYAGLASSGFNYSQDGKNWISYNEGLPQDLNTTPPNHTYYTHDVYAVDGNDQYIFAGTKEGIFRSEKSNLSWVNLYSIAGNKKVNALLCIDSNVFMSTENNIFRSTDNGSSWVLSHQFSSGNTISKLQNINDTIFASTLQDGIYSTSDLGVTWQSMNEGLNNLSAFSITKHKNTFYLADGDGVYKNLSHWDKVSRHIICSDVIDLEKSDSGIAAVDFYNVWISKDDGLAWTNTTDSIPIDGIRSVVNLDSSFFFSANCPPFYQSIHNNYIYSDTLSKWTKKTILPYTDDPYRLRSNGRKVIAVEDDFVYLSEDDGSSWKDISPPKGLVCNNFNDALFVGDRIYIAACGHAEVLETSDYGLHWVLKNKGLPNQEVYTLGECQGVIFAATNSFLYRFLETGKYWEYAGKGVSKFNFDLTTHIEDFASNDQYFFVCTSDSIYASNNQGHSWSNINTGLPALPNYLWGGSLLATDSTLYFGTNNYGVWKLDISQLTLPIDSLRKFDKLVVYPNPTKGMVNFNVPENEIIERVDIIDMSGRMVQLSLLAHNKINISHFHEGLYILRILMSNNKLVHFKILKIS